MSELDPRVAQWLARVADALKDVSTLDVGYGQFELGDIAVTFDGEPTGMSIGPSEFSDGFSIHLKDAT